MSYEWNTPREWHGTQVPIYELGTVLAMIYDKYTMYGNHFAQTPKWLARLIEHWHRFVSMYGAVTPEEEKTISRANPTGFVWVRSDWFRPIQGPEHPTWWRWTATLSKKDRYLKIQRAERQKRWSVLERRFDLINEVNMTFYPRAEDQGPLNVPYITAPLDETKAYRRLTRLEERAQRRIDQENLNLERVRANAALRLGINVFQAEDTVVKDQGMHESVQGQPSERDGDSIGSSESSSEYDSDGSWTQV